MSTLARVLVVDDDLDVAEVLLAFFVEENYEVRVAGNGRIGLDLVMLGRCLDDATPNAIPDADRAAVMGALAEATDAQR